MYVPTLPAFREAVEISTAAVVLDKDEEEVEDDDLLEAKRDSSNGKLEGGDDITRRVSPIEYREVSYD